MSTRFGQNPSFNSFHFSGANTLNQEAISAVGITAPGRVIDLNVFWDGDGSVVSGANLMWNNGGAIEIQSAGYNSGTGSESTGGQHLHTTSHNYFFTTTHNVNVGFFRTKSASSVVSVNTGGTDGITLTTSSNVAQSMSGASSFNSQYGSLGKGAMRAYGDYVPSQVYVRRGGAWVAISVYIKRGGAWVGPVPVYVRRGGAWVQLNCVPADEWDDKIEKRCLIEVDGTLEEGIIRDEGKARFGNVIDKLHNWIDHRLEIPEKKILIPRYA